MVAFRWINMFLFLIPVLQFTVTAQNPNSFAATVGVDISLPCKVTDHHCNNITWMFSHSDDNTTLFRHGKIHTTKSDRQSVSSDCSLNIKTVTVEDVGRYTCRQHRSGGHHALVSEYDLSVVDTTIKTKTTPTIKSTSTRTSTSELAKPTTLKPPTTKAKSTKEGTNTTATTTDSPPAKQVWWWFVIASVGLAVLVITVVVLIRWKRAKEKKTQTDENLELTSDLAVTPSAPETRQDTADPEDDVSYASISYTKKTNSKAQVLCKNDGDDEGYAVTYSTVKASSSAAGASANLNNLYTTVNEPGKYETTV